SRERIGLFRHVILKPNAREAMRAVRPNRQSEATRVEAEDCGAEFYRQCGRPVFVTLGLDGVLVCDDHGCQHVPAVPIVGPVDIVGAGDSTMAGIVSALCAGASPGEAALIGNLVASITIQQVGTTGTASPEQVRERFGELIGMGLFPGTSASSGRP
ncbi:MAG: PfkB family carbohydrate kinase, partial [Chloroflexota bacterium]